MAVSSRKVKNKRDSNGRLTGNPGTVYDVNIKYATADGKKAHVKKGFATKQEASQYEAEMKVKLSNPTYTPVFSAQSKQTVKEYLGEWIENHKINLRPSTYSSYKCHIENHINPYVGHIRLKELTPAMLDSMFRVLYDEKKLSKSTVRYAQRILSVSLEAARKYRYIETNPARDVITKFGKQGETPEPYNITEVQRLMGSISGTEHEVPVVLAGLYGLRISEIIGLRWRNVDIGTMQFSVIEQMPFNTPAGTKTIDNMAPTKSNGRVLPITETTLPYFERQLKLQERRKTFSVASGTDYFDNDLVVAKPDGTPLRRDRVSANFGQHLRYAEMRHICFHETHGSHKYAPTDRGLLHSGRDTGAYS